MQAPRHGRKAGRNTAYIKHTKKSKDERFLEIDGQCIGNEINHPGCPCGHPFHQIPVESPSAGYQHPGSGPYMRCCLYCHMLTKGGQHIISAQTKGIYQGKYFFFHPLPAQGFRSSLLIKWEQVQYIQNGIMPLVAK